MLLRLYTQQGYLLKKNQLKLNIAITLRDAYIEGFQKGLRKALDLKNKTFTTYIPLVETDSGNKN